MSENMSVEQAVKEIRECMKGSRLVGYMPVQLSVVLRAAEENEKNKADAEKWRQIQRWIEGSKEPCSMQVEAAKKEGT